MKKYGLRELLNAQSRMLLEQQEMTRAIKSIQQNFPVVIQQQRDMMKGIVMLTKQHNEIRQEQQEISRGLRRNGEILDQLTNDSKEMKTSNKQMLEDNKEMKAMLREFLKREIQKERQQQPQEGGFRGMVRSSSRER